MEETRRYVVTSTMVKNGYVKKGNGYDDPQFSTNTIKKTFD